MTAVVVGLAFATALLAVLVVGLLRSHAEILRALHDLGVDLETGTRAHTERAGSGFGIAAPTSGGLGDAHDITGQSPEGAATRVAVAGVDHDTLLAFLSSGCGTCASFWTSLRAEAIGDLPGNDTRLVVITQGAGHEAPAAIASLASSGEVPVVMSSSAWDDYGVPVSPYFVLVDGRAARVIGEGAGTSWEQVSALLRRAGYDNVTDSPGVTRRPSARTARQHAQDVDEELWAAGIAPGDPRLYHEGDQ